MFCKHCRGHCVKKGISKNGIQRYRCAKCLRYQQYTYRYNAYMPALSEHIKRHVIRGSGIRDTAFILKVSPTTVIKYIKLIAKTITPPLFNETNQVYEMDEMQTKIWPSQEAYVSYAINRKHGGTIAFTIGGRDKVTLNKVVSKVLNLSPRRIYTDGHQTYPSLIPPEKHIATKYRINKIERSHLTMRTRLKRLNRNLLCYSRSTEMLDACLKIYFWGTLGAIELKNIES